ncbi:restriction endonuclease subunit S [Faecalibacterium prausnitzii]|uniref:restriction endonuclease subunit S n=1 Tax=Faecalibacterium prausnitzii TaxID=853 RepID=UPI0026655DAB|nr:restriction endonuclease subunit S [Faecalibacterium prausnitzii]
MGRKMKDSGIEWIKSIPVNWECKRGKQLFIETNERSIAGTEELLTVSHITGVTPRRQKNVNMFMSESLTGYKICHPGDIAANTMWLWQGAVGVSNYHGVISPSYNTYRQRTNDYDSKYLDYLLRIQPLIDTYAAYSTGITLSRLRLYPESFLSIYFIVPPLTEQQHISSYLDVHCSEIDAMLSKTRSSIEEYKKLKQAVITQAVTKGVHGNREMKDSGVAWIGEIPKEWGRTKIKMIASFFNGDRTSRYPQPSDFVDSGVAFLTSRNIDSDEVDLSETKYITEDKYKSLSGAKIQIDDIIFCLRGSVGKCAINRTLSCGTVASSLATIRPKDIYPKYLLYFLLSNIASTQTTIFMNGTCAANLSAENVGNYYITLPISTEQKEIADYLDAKCAEIDKLIAKKEQLVKELESYKKSLIYEVVTGKREV